MKPPDLTRDHETLARIAAYIRDARADGDPKLVAAGRMTAAEATDRLRIATALAADWRRVVDRTPSAKPLASEAEKQTMLNHALVIWRGRHERVSHGLREAAPYYARYDMPALAHLAANAEVFGEEVRRTIVKLVRPLVLADLMVDAIEALAWWEHQTGPAGIQALTDFWIASAPQSSTDRIAA